MQEDFHYYCVGVLARAAGFNSEDALVVAYASQYVDDATESEQIPLEIKGGNLKFDPVRTAYDKLKPDQGLDALNWSAQKRIFIPFHFIPRTPFDPRRPRNFTFVTEFDSIFARCLLEEAVREKDRTDRLCRIGVALHTYADTWSHAGFSGRRNEENDVERIELFDRSQERWERLKFENLMLDWLPQIGHAEAGLFPDLAFQKWRCTTPSNDPLERDNAKTFLEAAKCIYTHLCEMEKPGPAEDIPWTGKSVKVVPWKELAPMIETRLADEPAVEPSPFSRYAAPLYRLYHAEMVELRSQKWREDFKHLFVPPDRFSYDRQAWRRMAITGDTNWDAWNERQWIECAPRKPKPSFWGSLWVCFHRAALRQRHFVLERMP